MIRERKKILSGIEIFKVFASDHLNDVEEHEFPSHCTKSYLNGGIKDVRRKLKRSGN